MDMYVVIVVGLELRILRHHLHLVQRGWEVDSTSAGISLANMIEGLSSWGSVFI